jgi:hypothetical protein
MMSFQERYLRVVRAVMGVEQAEGHLSQGRLGLNLSGRQGKHPLVEHRSDRVVVHLCVRADEELDAPVELGKGQRVVLARDAAGGGCVLSA